MSATPTALPSAAPSPDPSPSALPSPVASASPAPAAETAPTGGPVMAQITSIDLRSPPKGQPRVQMIPQALPMDLPPFESADPKAEASWEVKLVFQSAGGDDLTILSGKQAVKFALGQATLPVTVRLGKNVLKITVIDGEGGVLDYEATLQVSRIAQANLTEPKGFLVMGPVVYSRSISRDGAAAGSTVTKAGALTTGLRTIYRRRLFKEITDALPGRFKIFFDGSGTLGKTVTGDATASGYPLWADARMTMEVFSTSGFRVEGGAGFSFFSPFLSTTAAGDLEQYFGFVLSARVGYPIAKNVFGLLGAAASLPNSSSSSSDVLVTQPLEVFASMSIPRGRDGFWELRLKYYQVSTSGTVVKAGDFERKESFFGPEFLWVFRF